MEKIEYNTPEEKNACDLIRQHRRYQRTYYYRTYLCYIIDTDKESRKNICVDINISLNKKTGVVGVAAGVRCGRHPIYATVNQKLRCTNKHAIDTLKEYIEFTNKKRERRIDFNEVIGYHIMLCERLSYFEDSGNIGYYSNFQAGNKLKLKYINEYHEN